MQQELVGCQVSIFFFRLLWNLAGCWQTIGHVTAGITWRQVPCCQSNDCSVQALTGQY